MGSLFESQVFTGYDWALPEAVKSVAGDEHCWKWGCENFCVLAVGTLTERPLEQMTHPQTQPPPPQCTNAHFGCFPFHTHFVSKKYFNIPVIFFFLHFSSLCMPTLPLQFLLGGFSCRFSLPNQQTPWVSCVICAVQPQQRRRDELREEIVEMAAGGGDQSITWTDSGNGLKEARAVRQGLEEKELKGKNSFLFVAKVILQSGPISVDTGGMAGWTMWQQDWP